MFIDDNIVNNSQALACAFADFFCREKRVEYFMFYVFRNTRAGVAYSDFSPFAFASG